MSEWKKCTLGDVITLQRGHDLTYAQMKNGDIPVAGSNGIIGYHSSKTTNRPCVTIGRSGSIGNAFFYDCDCWAHNTVLYVKDFKTSNPKYIYYLLKNLDFTQFNAGSAVPTLNRNHIHPLSINIPLFNEQRDIAEILSSLDDKIDLLTRQNITLEALAQTYFRQWFVDNGINEEIELGNLAMVSTGKGLNKDKYNDCGKYPVMGANGKIGRTDEYLLDEEVILTGRVGTHGKIFLINSKVWISDNALIIKPMKNLYKYALYFLLQSLDYESLNVGSTQPLITQTDLKNQTIFASNMLFERFHDKVAIYFKKIEHNNAQIQTLQKLRDTLLPKLISGEVKIHA
ncbi:MAG: restriction endonuclease subunit S [Oscillospiraceae bacterium]|nr:restriction endonuclease subunit S [Oscillospiraceae bacterium]